MAQAVDLVVHRAVLLDVRVARRDVGLGLVVVVVRDEVLHPVVGEELSELVGQLRRQRLVRSQHEGGPLHLLDRPGDRGALARARDPEKGLEAVASLDALGERGNGGGLITRRFEVGDHPEGGHPAMVSTPCDSSASGTEGRRAASRPAEVDGPEELHLLPPARHCFHEPRVVCRPVEGDDPPCLPVGDRHVGVLGQVGPQLALRQREARRRVHAQVG